MIALLIVDRASSEKLCLPVVVVIVVGLLKFKKTDIAAICRLVTGPFDI
jgi:hypothetical protein